MNGWLEALLASAFVAGLAGGAHCAAMCGGLAGIACGRKSEGTGRGVWWSRALAYNAGRIASYAAAGALAGGFGAAGLALRATPLTHQALLAAMSLSMILFALYLAGFTPFVRAIETAGGTLWRHIQPHSRRFLPADSAPRAFGLGVLWGWLPCGMVYAALIAALATANPLHGGMVMAAFGLGTLPNLLAVGAWLGYVAKLAKARGPRLIGAALIAAVGVFGMLKAAQPATVAGDGLWCLNVPGLSALFSDR
jgi:sulfite exporter TauE/SafE